MFKNSKLASSLLIEETFNIWIEMILFSGGLRFGINFLQFIGDNYLIKNVEKKVISSPASFEEKNPLQTSLNKIRSRFCL